MQAILPNSRIFDQDQEVEFSVVVWDTPHTGGYLDDGTEFVSNGLVYRPSTALDGFGTSFSFDTASLEDYHAHYDTYTDPGLKNSSGAEVEGRIPVIHEYWGTGAPAGVRVANRVAIRLKGVVRETGSKALVFSGQGLVRAFHNGSPINILTEENAGVLPPFLAFRDYEEGDEVEVFYWCINEAWGGWSIRVCGDEAILDDELGLDWEVIREEPILSSAWMDDGEEVVEETLRDVSRAEIQARGRGQGLAAKVTLAIAEPTAANGWKVDPSSDAVIHNATGFSVKLGQRIKVRGSVGLAYREFTGVINDINPSKDSVVVECANFQDFLAGQISENYPDRLSYAAFGYTNEDGVTEPVFGVPAYDHWPYEHAIKDLCWRAWIDPSLLTAKRQVIRVGEEQVEDGSDLFRCRGLSGDHIRISRQPHYGNPDGSPESPPDDEYLTPSEITTTLLARIQSLVDRIGYKFGTDRYGKFFLRPINNPDAVVPLYDFDTGGTEVINPAAIKGKYREYTGNAWSHEQTGIKGSRIELVVGRGEDLGTVRVVVTRDEDAATLVDDTFDLGYPTELFFYDRRTDADGDNLCVFPVLTGSEYGTHTVTITPSGAEASTEFRLDGLRVYEQDPSLPHPELALRTLKNTLTASSRSNSPRRVNDAVVVGVRRTTATDSDKFGEGTDEWVVSRSQDVHSIFNPNAANYLGRKITAYLSDESIGDQDLADWTATTIVARFRKIDPDATVEHTAIPVIEVGDPIYVTDDDLNVFDGATPMYVTGFTTVYEDSGQVSATTRIEATAYALPPSFEPPEEIDLEPYNNKPAINLDISYPSLQGGTTVSNPGRGLAVQVRDADRVLVSTTVQLDGNGYYITIPDDTWSPGSELFRTATDAYKNYPYYTYYRRSSGTRLDLVFEGGNGTPSVYGPEAYISENDPVSFSYIQVSDQYAGESPFYDPYSSELTPPSLINIKFDALVSGYYRVSVVDARDANNERVVAWLTEPSTTDPDGRRHWTFIGPGKEKTFRWDGVDTLGVWNKEQTEDLISSTKNLFPEVAERFRIGAGYYAQNDQTAAVSHISSEEEDGEAVYPVGKFSQFYIKVECRRAAEDEWFIVRSNHGEDTKTGDLGDLFDTNANEIDSRYIYYHLSPMPNRVTTNVLDWDFGAAGAFNLASPGTSWSEEDDEDATFRDLKPVKIEVDPVVRKGALFKGAANNISVKVSRVAHLAALCMDECLVSFGEPWNAVSESTEEKRLITRRTINDGHTLVFADPTFTRGDELEDWIFYPGQFEDDFGDGEEALNYRDYTQLFEVPHWNPQRRIGDKRSRLILSYLAYLFYMSVFTQDRSGRLAWAIDPSHVDRSKITNNDQEMDWPHSLDRHQRRVVYTRQWWDSDAVSTDLGGRSIDADYWGFYSNRLNPFDTENTHNLFRYNNGTFETGSMSTGITDWRSQSNVQEGYLPDGFNTSIEFNNLSLGTWTWETEGAIWIPAPSRDFHPYYLVPPMSIASREETINGRDISYWEQKYAYAHTYFNTEPSKRKRDEAQNDTWFTHVTTGHPTTLGFSFYAGVDVAAIFVDKSANPTSVPSTVMDFQKIDETVRYEESRGGVSHGAWPARDLVQVSGGDPYYLNPLRYRYFRRHEDNPSGSTRRSCDVSEQGWFDLTFRQTYVWESPSLFPVIGTDRLLVPQAIDRDLTGWHERSQALDPGAWTGWKDDHPSDIEKNAAFQDVSASCHDIHWRYDGGGGFAGGTCSEDNPGVELDNEDHPVSYTLGRNIFQDSPTPWGVGPRLPETRRVIFSLVLVNNRRENPL